MDRLEPLPDYRERLGVPYILAGRGDDRSCREDGCPWLAATGSPLCRKHKTRDERRHGTPAQRLRWFCEVAAIWAEDWIWERRDRRRA